MNGIAYAILTLGSAALWGFVNGWLLYFYIPPAEVGSPLVPVALYSIVMLISRGVNLAISLPIGYLSDRTRTRWGRRMPYIAIASLLMPVLFLLLWFPPDRHESLINLAYVATIAILFNMAYSVRQIPYEALLPEFAPKDEERVNISGWQAGFQFVGVILAGFAGPAIDAMGYNGAAWIFAGTSIPFLMFPLLFLRENAAYSIVPSEQISFTESIRLTFRNRIFLTFILAWGFSWMASTFILETLPYIVTEICQRAEADTVYFYLPAVIVSLACFPLVTRLANKYGKQRIFAISLAASALALPLLLLISPRIPVPLMAQGIVWVILQAVTMSGIQVLPFALLAEITDIDGKQTGQRREGSYYSAWGMFDQLFSGLAGALMPLFLLLGRSQGDPNGPLGVRLLGLAGGLLVLAGFLVFLKFPSRQSD